MVHDHDHISYSSVHLSHLDVAVAVADAVVDAVAVAVAVAADTLHGCLDDHDLGLSWNLVHVRCLLAAHDQ